LLVWEITEVLFISRDRRLNISFIYDVESISLSKPDLPNSLNVTCKYLGSWDWDCHVFLCKGL